MDKSMNVRPQQQRIDMQQDAEVNEWTRRLDVSRDELQTAVDVVGDVIEDVHAYIRITRAH